MAEGKAPKENDALPDLSGEGVTRDDIGFIRAYLELPEPLRKLVRELFKAVAETLP